MLSSNESFFPHLFEALPIGILVLKQNEQNPTLFQFAYLNDLGRQIIGRNEKDWTGQTPTQLFTDSTKWEEILPTNIGSAEETMVPLQYFSNHIADQLEKAQTSRLEKEFWVIFLYPKRVSTDLPPKKDRDTDEALKFHQKIFQNSPDILYVYDLQEQRNVMISRSIEEELGYTQEDLHNMRAKVLETMIHPEDLPGLVHHFQQVLPNLPDEEVHKRRERSLHNHTGTYVWYESLESVLERTEKGVVKSILGIARNVTEEVEKEQELLALNEKLAAQNKILQTPTDIIYVYNLKTGKNEYSNRAIYTVLGYSEAEIQKLEERILVKLTHPDDVEKVFNHHQKILPNLEDENTATIQYRMWNRDKNEYIWLESVEAVFDRDKSGSVLTIMGVARDVTIHKEAQEGLKTLNQELETLLYSVSHDLKAPVRHIDGYADYLKESDGDQLTKEGSNYLNSIINSSSRLGNMIDGLLSYLRSRNITINPTWVDTNKLVTNLQELYNHNLNSIPLNWNVQPLPNIFADQEMIKKVFEILISNAVKFSIPKKMADIHILATEEPSEVIFTVRDQGVGFDMKYYNKLFSIFRSLHKRTEFEGNGIGLANAERIIYNHGGRFWAESELNQGATFFFSIPNPLQI